MKIIRKEDIINEDIKKSNIEETKVNIIGVIRTIDKKTIIESK
jgi:hypothetical protein